MQDSTDCSSLLEHATEAECFVPCIIRRAKGRYIGIELEECLCRISQFFRWVEGWRGKVGDEGVSDYLFRGDVN
jgi:hypothetical protein